MNYTETINTIDDFSEITYKEKGSEFIGQVYHVESADEAEKILHSIKKKYYEATHHCFAYKLIDGTFRYSDDGEPNGTAGVRIFNAIEHFDLVNIFTVVIRYFGGTKLGVGPLGKAYYNTAFEVLNKSERKTKHLYEEIKIITDFDYISHVHNTVNNLQAKITNTKYDEKVNFICLIKPTDVEKLKNMLREISKGNIKVVPSNTTYYR